MILENNVMMTGERSLSFSFLNPQSDSVLPLKLVVEQLTRLQLGTVGPIISYGITQPEGCFNFENHCTHFHKDILTILNAQFDEF